jgi:hypothetical protein
VELRIDRPGFLQGHNGLLSLQRSAIDGPVSLADFKESFFKQRIQRTVYRAEIKICLINDLSLNQAVALA